MTNPGDALIPVTIHLDGQTFLAIEAAARRASGVAGRKVEMRELIERRLTQAVVGIAQPGMTKPRRPTEKPQKRIRGALTAAEIERVHEMTREGHSAVVIAAALRCHPNTIANHRRILRERNTPA